MNIELVKNIATRITAINNGNVVHSTSGFELLNTSNPAPWSGTLHNFYLSIEFPYGVNITNMVWDITADSVPLYKLKYSFENSVTASSVFREFEYFTYSVVDAAGALPHYPELKLEDIETYSGFTFKCVTGSYYDVDTQTSHPTYTIVMLEKGTNLASDKNVDALKNFLKEELFNTPSSLYVDKKYVFTYGDEALPLYDITPTIIRFEAVSESPYTLNKFEVYSNVTLTPKMVDLDLISDNFFQPKYFEEYPLLPSISKTFFQMLNYDKQRTA